MGDTRPNGRPLYDPFKLLTQVGPFASDALTNTYVNQLRTGLSLQQPTGLWTNGFAYDAARRLTNIVSPAGSFTNVHADQ
jgi:hypothetical protein